MVGIDGDVIKIYDPYLYSGKFETATRRGKVSVDGYNVYCSIDNFREYANYTKFFAYKNTNTQKNENKPVVTESYTRYVKANGGLNVRDNHNENRIGGLANGTQVTVNDTNGDWSYITSPTNGWVCSLYLVSNTSIPISNNTVGQIKKLSRSSILYSNSNLTGIQYNYKANTTITILQNISAQVDKIRVNVTGRIAYIDNSNYTNVVISAARGTVGSTRKLKASTLYSNSNLTGIRYQYKANTTITILENVSSNIDKIKVNVTGRIAYINTKSYK